MAFPDAEGFGKFTTGGRGGKVFVVSNLNDSGSGSLREAIESEGPRIIIFSLSGNIDLKSNLVIKNGDVTIAGHSAPGEGICIRNYPLQIRANNIIIRYMRFRLGDKGDVQEDAINARFLKNIMIDHCSMSWSIDECASFYSNSDFTMQWCIISESLNNSNHEKGPHGYGAIWGGNGATFHHNLIAHHNSRNPRFSGSSSTKNDEGELTDFRNNVIYNWGSNSIYGGESGRYNMVNNYFKPGPATKKLTRNRIVNPSEPYGKFYIEGNFVYGDAQVSYDNWAGGVHCDDPEAVKSENSFGAVKITSQHTAQKAYRAVLKRSGASLKRDEVDQRIIKNVKEGSATVNNGIIDSQEDVGGWPELQSAPYPKDSDGDGMPDQWEKENNLDPTKYNANGNDLHEYYNNIEVYLESLLVNSIVEFDYIVSKDGIGDFKTIQSAIDAVPDMRKETTRILIKDGVYKEKLILPASKTNVTFIGENPQKTIITFDDFASKKNEFGEEIGTSGSAGFYVFGDGFTAQNITFSNTAGPFGQAVAVRVDGDKVIFENCRFLGFQDTLYPHGDRSRQYYKNCYIEGTTDFIFGWSTAVFEDCEIYSKEGGNYITAASTKEETEYGFVFLNCKLTGDAPDNSVFLGRPWREYAHTVFINCVLGKHINSEGWHNWSKPEAEKTAFYAEYNSTGPGANSNKRVKWSHQLTKKQLSEYTLKEIFGDWDPAERLTKLPR
ncbi:pectin methylesterase [Flammeovirgaceae bacterium KN852]|uniref:Pectin methylesterase n=2 Tax=Marinigracilibium pacificum TaxID=2729599 RepID=A0A848J1M5_9BACT|nr:pectin methylesterase [Marinigracilibium pacificum]